MSRHLIKSAFTYASILSSLPALAGGNGVGNGGGAWVCHLPDGSVSVELLDLKEGSLDGLNIPKRSESKDLQIKSALKRLAEIKPKLASEVEMTLSTLESKKIDLSGDLQLVPPTDTKLRRLKKERNCSLQGVAEYDDRTDKLTIDRELESLMTTTDQAALDFHEALYKVYRNDHYQAKNSLAVRKLTAAVFSNQKMSEFMNQSINPEFDLQYKCSSGNQLEFEILTSKQSGETQLSFKVVNGESLDESATFTFKELSTDDPASKTLKERIRTGFKSSDTVVPNYSWWKAWTKGDRGENLSKSFEKTFQTTSLFRPEIDFRVLVSDQVGVWNGKNHSSVFDRPKLRKNAFVLLNGQSIRCLEN